MKQSMSAQQGWLSAKFTDSTGMPERQSEALFTRPSRLYETEIISNKLNVQTILLDYDHSVNKFSPIILGGLK